jgi:pimeloyl-ACP methyl ester carboxylesterase
MTQVRGRWTRGLIAAIAVVAFVPVGTAAAATIQSAPAAPAWKTIPSWSLITLEDKAIAPAGQRFMAERAGAHIETVHSSHAVMVSHPEAVIRITLAAARA